MKRLTILRHAKSGVANGVDDFDRPLTDRGEQAARRVGEELKQCSAHFDLVLASPARRVRETLASVSESFGDLPVRFDEEHYLATEQFLLERIHRLPDDLQSVMLVGHNPGLERLIADLAKDDERGFRNRVIDGLPTAAVAILQLSEECWSEVKRGEAEFVDLILPQELA